MCNRIITLLFVLSFVAGSLLHAHIIHVPSDSSTIQGGINGATEGDTVMVAPGTYYETNIDFLGKRIVVMGTDPRDSAIVATTIVDADSQGSVFVFRSGERYTSELNGFTIRGGILGQNAGGVDCDQASPTVQWNVITDNHGFGINLRSSGARITENTISQNRVGIVTTSSNSTIIYNTIESNSNTLGSGGGIFAVDSDLSVGYNSIRGNSAVDGGGIYSDHSTLYIHEDSIIGNTASGNGGGLHCRFSDTRIFDCIISGNEAQEGGGFYDSEAVETEIYISTISENSAVGKGGGVMCTQSQKVFFGNNLILANTASEGGGFYLDRASIEWLNNSYTENSAESGGGIFMSNASGTIDNEIFWNNHADTGPQLTMAGGDTLLMMYSDMEGGEESIATGEGSVLIWGDGMISVDPLFRDVGNEDFHLMAVQCGDTLDSPCIDVGDPGIEDANLSCEAGLGETRSDMGPYGGLNYLFIGDEGPEVVPLPKTLTLTQNYPNPFNPSTTILYEIPEGLRSIPVILSIYDVRGRQIRKLVDEEKTPGRYRVHWDGRDNQGRSVSSGIYLYRIKAGVDVRARKMVIVR